MTTAEFEAQLRRKLRDTKNAPYFFSDDEITDFTDVALKKLWPAIWNPGTYSVIITDTNKRQIEFNTPGVEVTQFFKIRVRDSSDDYVGDYNSFYVANGDVFAKTEFPIGYTFEFEIASRITAIEDAPEKITDLILSLAELEAYESLMTDKARYYKYTTSIRPEGSSLGGLSGRVEQLEKSIRERKNELRMTRPAQEMDLDD